MAVRIGIGIVILAAVGLLAWWLQRRPPGPPPRDSYPVPKQLDRDDFPRPDAAWLVALFSSSDCDSCQGLGEKMLALESPDVVTTEVEARRALCRLARPLARPGPQCSSVAAGLPAVRA